MPDELCVKHERRLSTIEEATNRQEKIIGALIDKIDTCIEGTLRTAYILENGLSLKVAEQLEKLTRRRRWITTTLIAVGGVMLGLLEAALVKGWI